MKTTLVAVSGMSPAIITETLWALAQEEPPVLPDDVIVITTSKGKEDLERDLLGGNPDWDGQSVWETLRTTLLREAGLAEAGQKLQLSLRVIDVFTHQILGDKHFHPHEGGIYLNDDGRAKFIVQYERRMERQFMSEFTGHRTTLRQQLEDSVARFKRSLEDPSSFEAFVMN